MNKKTAGHRGISRRTFLAAAGLGTVAMGKENNAWAAEKKISGFDQIDPGS